MKIQSLIWTLNYFMHAWQRWNWNIYIITFCYRVCQSLPCALLLSKRTVSCLLIVASFGWAGGAYVSVLTDREFKVQVALLQVQSLSELFGGNTTREGLEISFALLSSSRSYLSDKNTHYQTVKGKWNLYLFLLPNKPHWCNQLNSKPTDVG